MPTWQIGCHKFGTTTLGNCDICTEIRTLFAGETIPSGDMCKAVDRGMTITDVKLLEKHGGKSGSFVREK